MSETIELKIAPRWKWTAKDKDGKWWVYDEKPTPTESVWDNTHGDAVSIKIFSTPEWQGDWKDSLHQIIDGKLVKFDVPGDGERVIVGPCNRKRYSAGRLNKEGHLLCYNGGDKWTSGGATSMWTTWRRPTPEELAE